MENLWQGKKPWPMKGKAQTSSSINLLVYMHLKKPMYDILCPIIHIWFFKYHFISKHLHQLEPRTREVQNIVQKHKREQENKSTKENKRSSKYIRNSLGIRVLYCFMFHGWRGKWHVGPLSPPQTWYRCMVLRVEDHRTNIKILVRFRLSPKELQNFQY